MAHEFGADHDVYFYFIASKCLASQQDNFPGAPQIIEIVSPGLHHSHPLGTKLRSMHIGTADIVGFLVRKLPFDGIGIPPSHFVKSR